MKHVFSSLASSISGATAPSYLNTNNLVAGNYQLNLPCYYDTGPDTTAVTVDGYTTGSANYLKIYTPNNTISEVNQSQRHSGKWDDVKYSLQATGVSGGVGVVEIISSHVRLDGLQTLSNAPVGSSRGVRYYQPSFFTTDIRVSNSIMKSTNPSSNQYNAGIYFVANGGTLSAWNNIFYDFRSSGEDGHSSGILFYSYGTNYIYAYNNTIYNCYQGLAHEGGSPGTYVIVAKNNIVKGSGNANAYVGTFTNSDYNATDGTDADDDGSNSRRSQTFSFVDETNKDFHLASTDTGAKGYATPLFNDPYAPFQNDIDGDERTGNWSIGADEPTGTTVQSSELSAGSITDGLVLYQSFDGPYITGNTAVDQSSYANNGTINGATPARGKKGQALSFDGTSNYVETGTMNYLPVFTVSAWVKSSSAPNNSSMSYAYAYRERNFLFRWNDNSGNSPGSIGIVHGGGYQGTTIGTVLPNQWYHIVSVFDGTTLTAYNNGVFASSIQPGSPDDVGTSFFAIGDAFHSNYFNGSIDEVRIYDRALSADEISSLYRLGGMEINSSTAEENNNGLVGHWTFDGQYISGNTALDSSGNGNSGQISGATPARGKKGQALIFDGTSSYINMGSNVGHEGASAVSLSLWFKCNSVQQSQNEILVSQTGPGPTYTIQLGREGNPYERMRFSVYTASGNDYAGSIGAEINDTEWHHAVGVYDGSIVKLYIDGVTRGREGSITGNINNTTTGLVVGGFGGASNVFPGLIDDVRVYDRALSADEVKDLYNMGTATLSR